jgi:hypothetical protein
MLEVAEEELIDRGSSLLDDSLVTSLVAVVSL